MIHATAIIDPTAQLADDVEVGPYSIIGPQVEIGAGTVIGAHAVIMGPCRIGRGNRIFQFSSVGGEPQDKKYAGEPTALEVGDENVIREYVTISRGTVTGLCTTVIGTGHLLMSSTHVAHDCIVGDHCVLANGASLAGHVEVGDHAILGGFSLVHQFTQIGTGAFCGMGSLITSDVPRFSAAAGALARLLGLNREGLIRKGFTPELIRALHKSFRELLKSRESKPDVYTNLAPLCAEFAVVAVFGEFHRE